MALSRVRVSRVDSPHVHAAQRGAGGEAGRVISPVRTLCGRVLSGELVDVSSRPFTCQECFREVYGRRPTSHEEPDFRRLFVPGGRADGGAV
jgi:hypothetical protein